MQFNALWFYYLHGQMIEGTQVFYYMHGHMIERTQVFYYLHGHMIEGTQVFWSHLKDIQLPSYMVHAL